MAMLDVFEMTNSELNKTLSTKSTNKKVTESNSKKKAKRRFVKESVGRRFRSIKKIPANTYWRPYLSMFYLWCYLYYR